MAHTHCSAPGAPALHEQMHLNLSPRPCPHPVKPDDHECVVRYHIRRPATCTKPQYILFKVQTVVGHT